MRSARSVAANKGSDAASSIRAALKRMPGIILVITVREPTTVSTLSKIGLFVFLQILVVRQRQRLKRGQNRHEVAVYSTRLASNQLAGVWILLLRHYARARAKLVGQITESELLRFPDDQLLGEDETDES